MKNIALDHEKTVCDGAFSPLQAYGALPRRECIADIWRVRNR